MFFYILVEEVGFFLDCFFCERMSVPLDFRKICRVCCLEGTMMSVFKVHISKKLMACASIQVKS